MSCPAHQTKDSTSGNLVCCPADIELVVQKAVETAMKVFQTEFLQLIREKIFGC